MKQSRMTAGKESPNQKKTGKSTESSQRSALSPQSDPTCGECRYFTSSQGKSGLCFVRPGKPKVRKETDLMCGMFEKKEVITKGTKNAKGDDSTSQNANCKVQNAKPESQSTPANPSEAIKQFRAKYGLTQRQTAEMLGVSSGYLANIEIGKCKIPPDLEDSIFNLIKTYKPSAELAEKTIKNLSLITQQLSEKIEFCIAMRKELSGVTEILHAGYVSRELAQTANSLAYKTFLRSRTALDQIEKLSRENPNAYPEKQEELHILRYELRDVAIWLLKSRVLSEKVQAVVCEWLDQGLQAKLKAMPTRETEMQDE